MVDSALNIMWLALSKPVVTRGEIFTDVPFFFSFFLFKLFFTNFLTTYP